MLVSICLPCYNCERTVRKTIESILAQSYKNIEIIISNNASTDNTKNIIESIHDKRIKIYNNKKNIGYVNNINSCIKKSKGKYICVFHSDDVYDNNIIEKEVEYMNMYNDVGAVFTLRRLIDENGKFIKNIELPFKYKGDYIIGGKKTIFPAMLQYGNFFVCPSAMVRKTVYDKVGLWEVEPSVVEDQNMWLRILEHYRVIIINKKLMKYRKHSSQDSVAYNKLRVDISSEYMLYDTYIKKWKAHIDMATMKKYNFMKAKGYLFCATNSLLVGNYDKVEENLSLTTDTYKFSYFSVFFWIRLFLGTIPRPLSRGVVKGIVGLLKLTGVQKQADFLNYM